MRIDLKNTKHQQNLRNKEKLINEKMYLLEQFAMAALAGMESNVGANKWNHEKFAENAYLVASSCIEKSNEIREKLRKDK